MTRVALGGAAVDLDLSPNGQHLVVRVQRAKQVAVVDTSTFALTSVPTSAGVWAVAVDNTGRIYYWDHQGDLLHRMDLAAGTSSDFELVTPYSYEPPALQLSADGGLLYCGARNDREQHLQLERFGRRRAAGGRRQLAGRRFRIRTAARYLYLGPSGKNVYYAGCQLDATQLTFVRGPSGSSSPRTPPAAWRRRPAASSMPGCSRASPPSRRGSRRAR